MFSKYFSSAQVLKYADWSNKYIRETNIERNKYFIFLSFTAIKKILQQTKIPITIPYTHSINIYKHNNIIL